MAEVNPQTALYILLSQFAKSQKLLNLPSHERDDSGHAKYHARFLNAVVSFLRTEPGQVLALSMEVTATRILINVAGNRRGDVTVTPSLNQAIEDVWTLMKRVAAAVDEDERDQALRELAVYLLKRHWKVMQKCFQKGESMCGQFFEHIDSTTPQLSASVQRYLELARLIYKHMAELFKGKDSPSDKDASVLWSQGYVLVQALRNVRKNNKAALDANLVQLEPDVEKKADDTAVQERRAPGKRVTLVRYIEKLISPFDHVLNLYKAVIKPPIADILQSEVPFAVRVHFHDTPEVRPLDLPQPVLERFLNDVARSSGADQENETAIAEVVEELSKATLDTLATAPTVHPSHCECFLLHHLVNDRDSRQPLPYVAVSKLSCLQCALYFEGYEKFRTGRSPALPPFAIRGCHHNVIVCLLPSQESSSSAPDPMDSFIGDYIVERVKGWLKIIIKDEVDSRNRRHSQSTVASASSSDDDDVAFGRTVNFAYLSPALQSIWRSV